MFFASFKMPFCPNYWWHFSACAPQLSIRRREDGNEHNLKHETCKYLLKGSTDSSLLVTLFGPSLGFHFR